MPCPVTSGSGVSGRGHGPGCPGWPNPGRRLEGLKGCGGDLLSRERDVAVAKRRARRWHADSCFAWGRSREGNGGSKASSCVEGVRRSSKTCSCFLIGDLLRYWTIVASSVTEIHMWSKNLHTHKTNRQKCLEVLFVAWNKGLSFVLMQQFSCLLSRMAPW